MTVIWQLQLLLISGMVLFTGAELSLTVVTLQKETQITGQNVPVNFECDSELTLVCEIKPYEDSAVWQVNGTTYALCIFSNCFTYPPFPENTNFSMDTASEVFNLTVDPVTISSNRSIFRCDDGATVRSVEAFVIVQPKNETLKIDTSFTNQITVTTGCVYPKGIQDLTFEWFISEDNISINIEDQLPTKVNDSTTVFDCTETSGCAGEETAHFNNTVIFDSYNSGNEYFICVTIKLNDTSNRPSAVICSDRSYIVKSDISSNNENACSWLCIIGIIIGAVIAIACITGVIIFKTSKLDAPTQFRVIRNNITETSITVAWEPGKSLICGLCGLKQKFILSRSKFMQYNLVTERPTTKHTHCFKNLTKGTYYRLYIYAVNCIGKSPASKSLRVRTRGDGVPYQPTDFRIIKETISSVTVQWKPGNNGGYDQEFLLNNSENEKVVTIEDEHDPIMSYAFQKLSLKKNCQLIIRARNEKGSTPPVSVWTKNQPDPPTDFTVIKGSVTETTITFQWKPGFDGGYVQTFVLTDAVNGNRMNPPIEDTGKDQMELTLNGLSKGNYYSVSLHAENKIGNSSPVGPLVVRTTGQPDPPTDFAVIKGSVTETSITFQWKPGFDGECPQKFILTDTVNGNRMHPPIKDTGKEQSELTLNGLSKGTSYSVSLHAENEKGKSSPVGPLVVRTLGQPDSQTDFTFIKGSVTETSITFQWKPGFDGGYPQTFVLTDAVNGKRMHPPIKDTGKDQMELTLNGLSKGTYYSVQIHAENIKGKSSPVGPLVARTTGKPNKPTDFKLSGENSVTESSVTVEWKPGFDGGFPQTFKLCYEGNGNTGQVSVPDEKNQHTMTHTFEKLAKGTEYTISILATNQKGDSLQQDPLVVKTKAVLPNIGGRCETEQEHLPKESSNVSDKVSTTGVIIENDNVKGLLNNEKRMNSSANSRARQTDSSSRNKNQQIDKRLDTMNTGLTANFTDDNDNTPEVSVGSSVTSKGESTSM